MGITSYADDTQLVVAINNNGAKIAHNFQQGMLAISSWMADNCLKLNSDKTEVMIFGNLAPVWSPRWWPSDLGPPPVPVSKVKNLGVLFDNKLSFLHHTNVLVSTSFFIIKRIKKLLPYLPSSAAKTLISILVFSRLDYCNGLLINAQQKVLNRLQLVQNAAARLLTGIPKSKSTANAVRHFHWLTVRNRTKFKALCIAYKAIHNNGPEFLKH